jgi:hypothetical protein
MAAAGAGAGSAAAPRASPEANSSPLSTDDPEAALRAWDLSALPKVSAPEPSAIEPFGHSAAAHFADNLGDATMDTGENKDTARKEWMELFRGMEKGPFAELATGLMRSFDPQGSVLPGNIRLQAAHLSMHTNPAKPARESNHSVVAVLISDAQRKTWLTKCSPPSRRRRRPQKGAARRAARAKMKWPPPSRGRAQRRHGPRHQVVLSQRLGSAESCRETLSSKNLSFRRWAARAFRLLTLRTSSPSITGSLADTAEPCCSGYGVRVERVPE